MVLASHVVALPKEVHRGDMATERDHARVAHVARLGMCLSLNLHHRHTLVADHRCSLAHLQQVVRHHIAP